MLHASGLESFRHCLHVRLTCDGIACHVHEAVGTTQEMQGALLSYLTVAIRSQSDLSNTCATHQVRRILFSVLIVRSQLYPVVTNTQCFTAAQDGAPVGIVQTTPAEVVHQEVFTAS
jgi:hypothetical protein